MANAYEVIKISDGAWRIEEQGVRCFLFVGTERALLVDSGFGTGELKSVVASLTELPVMLVNTHADGDHIGCNEQFDDVYLHPSEYAKFAESGREMKIHPIWDGETIDLGGRKFTVALIPGHTPGSIALLDKENKILVGGDTISKAAIFMFGQWRDVSAYIVSLEYLDAVRTDGNAFDTVYPSHGEFPVPASIIPDLIDGATKLRAGLLTPEEPPFDIPAKLYKSGIVSFLY